MKYLTNSGLSYFLNKIKTYIASQLNSKAAVIHTHTYSDITDLPNGYVVDSTLDGTSSNAISNSAVSNALDGKSDVGHTHTVSDVTDFPTLATVATSGSYNDLSNKPTTMTPTSHTHGNITNDGKIGSNANKPLITTTGGTVTTGSFGTTANTFCQGNDSRLSDARTPTAHTHTKSEITDFPTLATVATSGSYNDLSDKPTIPTNTNQLTNGAGFITSSGSCNYANSAGYVQGNNNSANAANALLRSGGGRGDSSPEGDTWIFFDECGSPDTPWGFKHNQGANTIGFYAEGAETSSINLSNGYFSGSCNYANSAGSAGSVAWSNVSGRPTALSQFTNDSGYITADGAAYPRRVGGVTMNFNWSGQGGQPTWLWGGEDGTNMYVYNPANFSVNYATNSGYTNWLRTSSHSDHLFHTEWDGSYFWTYVTAGDGGYRAVRVERSNSSGWADSAGSVAWSNVSGRPTALSQFTNDSGFLTSADRLPIGSYIQFAGSQAPAGFLVCNGGAISRTTYSALFAVIGTKYGSGNGSTTFNLPNLTDRFLQGSTTSGTVKNAGLPNITGYIRSPASSATEQQGVFNTNNLADYVYGSGNLYFWNWSFNASRSSSIYGNSSTVQPPALTCLICIKY